MPAGFDAASGSEPGPLMRRLVSPKDAAVAEAVAAGATVLEGRYVLEKYWGEVAPANLYEVVETAPNLFPTAGVTEVLKLAVGQAATAFNASNAYLCVGNGTTAAAAGDTDLAGASKYRQLVSGAPSVSGRSVTFSAQFAQGVANFAWAEVGVANASSGGALWSRTVPAGTLGTKSSAAVWVLNWTLTINAS